MQHHALQSHLLPSAPLSRTILCAAQTKDGMKMGKSLGNILEPGPLVEAYGHDAVRFFFLKEVIFGQVCIATSQLSLYMRPPLQAGHASTI